MTMAELFRDSAFSGEILIDEPMKSHCTFRSGGPAELFLYPRDVQDIIRAREICREHGIPLFILGGGANILVSDKGIPGVTLSMEKINHIEREEDRIICGAGLSVNELVKASLRESLTGLEFLNCLPGSVGGALFMNARCYGHEVADVLSWADILTGEDEILRIPLNRDEWDYKVSPFQKKGTVILRAAFQLSRGNRENISDEMERIARNRREKGHFKAPSAGSTFKNNRKFGKPSGLIIDECGLKGLKKGGASVAPWHGNIFINAGEATSSDISDLINEVRERVLEKTGWELDPEVIKVGNWDS